MTVINLPRKPRNYSEKLDLIEEILPNIKKYESESIVIHLDETTLYDQDLLKKFANDVVLLKRFGAHPIVVHGGINYVKEQFTKFNLDFKLDDGVVVTDDKTIDMLEMVLKGFVSSKIVAAINDAGGSAVGISGKDANLIEAKKLRKYRSKSNTNIRNIVDLGFNGEPTVINPEVLILFEESKSIPIISSIARGENGETFYIDSLMISSIIASSIVAGHYILISDQRGITDEKGGLIEYIDAEEFEKKQKTYNIDQTIYANIHCALDNHVGSIHIVNGKVPHALLLNLFTDDKVGTLISRSDDEELLFN